MKKNKKMKWRVVLWLLCAIIAFSFFVSNFFVYVTQIISNGQQIDELNQQYTAKLDEEKDLKSEINRLKDPEYMARYAREKYLYSAKNEIIIKIEE